MSGLTRINQAHWFGDEPIVSVAGVEVEFPASINTVFLEFKAISGVAYYTLEINTAIYQGTGDYDPGIKKFVGGSTVNIKYDIKNVIVKSYDSSDGLLAIGEVGYMGFIDGGSVTSYTVETP